MPCHLRHFGERFLCSNQTLALLDLWRNHERYEVGV
jgi:hypothetical protein